MHPIPPTVPLPPSVDRAPRRRRWRVWLAIGVAILLSPVALGLGVAAALWTRADSNTADRVDFATALAIPPLADSRIDREGRRVFDLRLQAGRTDFGLQQPTNTWGVNGSYLGPTLRAERGEQVVVNVTNDVRENTTLHWHGMHLPARMDGGPHQMIDPGTTWSPTWTIGQPAATLWYHPHLHGETAQHVARGLAGLFILDDGEAAALPLPDEYGVDDVPVIVQDKSFTGDGQLDDGGSFFSPTGFLGDTILVNGTIAPFHDVSAERVRLRLLNASNARIYNFGLDDNRPFVLVGTDGGLLSAAVEATRVQLSPGERAEIIVAMQPGENAVLRSYAAELGTDRLSQRFAGGDDILDILQLRAADRLTPSPAVPDRLADPARIDPAHAATTRTFRLSGTNINGLDMDMGRIDEVVTVGSTEIWQVTNRDGSPHSFHIHDVQFRVLDVNGREPTPALTGRKDTVYVAPGTTVRLMMRFTDYADADFPYMFHCHLLRHEDQGMMGQFVVVTPGERAGRPPGHATHAGSGDTAPHPEH